MFYGIRIFINYKDHNPPHFHAEYAGNQATINILTCTVMESSLPNKQLKLVLAWAELHKDKLMHNWGLSQEGDELISIEPLR